MRQRISLRLNSVLLSVAMAALICESVAAQVTSAPPPNSTLTPPARQAARPPDVRQQELPGTRATEPSKQTFPNGTIEGFVYWDATQFTHNPELSCSGLAITVSAGSSSGPFTQYTPIGTATDNFKFLQPVRAGVVDNKFTTYFVCTYAFDHVPVGVNLQVSLAVTQPTAFSPPAIPQYAILGPIQIVNGKCNMLPHITNPTVNDLTGHWSTCQNEAYNVNFVMHSLPRPPLSSFGGRMSGASQPGTQNGRLLNNSSPSQPTLLPANPQPGTAGLLSQVKPAPGSAVQLNPQPFPPGATANSVASTRKLPTRRTTQVLSPPQQGQKITNPKAGLQNSTIIAVLRKQSEAAIAETGEMKLSLRPAGVQTQPSTIMSASRSGGMLSPGSTVLAAGGTTPNPALAGSTPTSNRYGAMTPGMIPQIALQCGRDSSMRILNVNGGPHSAVFTQDSTNNFNFYTITGCSFGNPGVNAKAYIYYQGTFHEDFQIQLWNENFIALSLDPNLTGVDDQNDVTLVIQRNDGQQTLKTGNKFYAARSTVLLKMIPKTHFSLSQFRPDQSTVLDWKSTYTSGSSASVIPNLPGLSAEVHWDITTDPNGAIVGGKDDYDFSGLHSSFAIDSGMLEYRNLMCTDPNYNQLKASNDNWSLDWYGNAGMQVSWQAQTCSPNPGGCGGGPIVQNDCFLSPPESNYGVDVWVTGPRGVDPWTGKPVS